MKKLSLRKVACFVAFFFGAALISSSAQTLTVLANFDNTNGGEPYAPVIQSTDGSLYGTTYGGGAYLSGTVFKVTPTGTLTTLYSFCAQPFCPDGSSPYGGLVQGNDGNFYGTTYGGGTDNFGTIFKITAEGILITLHSFIGTDGLRPEAAMVQAADGDFYGTAYGGGSHSSGTVFEITPDGTFTTLHTFTGYGDGSSPTAGLVVGTDGSFYGTTYGGGANCTLSGCGTVFKITSEGALTTLYSFSGPDGSSPSGGLVQGTDGNFYGTTLQGGANGVGTVFKITPQGVVTSLYSFCSQTDCFDGSGPYAGLIQAIDGNFYGTTQSGGSNNGTVFKITPTGTLTTVHDFSLNDGFMPYADLVQGTGGSLYGTTFLGGNGDPGLGTVFSLSGPSSSPVQFVAVTPCRVVDTRNPNGTFGGPPIQGGSYRTFPIPQGACNIPSNATAYSLNVTVVPSGPLGYLTIWPSGKSRPLVSTMNSLDGRIKANSAILPAGATGAVSVYVSDTTNVVLDIDGYFTPITSSTLAFYPLTPCRVLDTRNANGDLGGPYLQAGQERNFPVLEGNCNIPNGAQAYSLNFTVVPYQGEALGYLTVWPTGESQPLVSTLNNLTGTIVANAAIVPAGTGGEITVYPSDDTQLVADIDGYFAPSGTGGLSLYPTVPCRVIDTRKIGNGQPFSGTLSPPVDVVDSACSIPSTAQGYVFNATVVPTGSLGYLTLWPDGEGQPVVSTLNAIDGAITSNMAIVPNVDGKIDAYASGLTQLILDISSYFAP